MSAADALGTLAIVVMVALFIGLYVWALGKVER